MLLLAFLWFFGQAGSSSPDLLDRAEELFRQERYSDAVQLLDKLAKSDPRSARAWAVLGASLSKLGRYSDAEHALTTAVHLDPNRPEVLKQLGWVYHQTGRLTEAEKVLREAQRANSSDPEILYVLALTKHAQHDYVAAATLTQQALAIHPDDLGSQLLLAQSLVDLRQYENAEWTYQAALRSNEKLPTPSEKPYAAYGQLLFVLNRLEGAERMFTQALKIDPRSAAALLGRAHVLESRQQHRAALADAELALALIPDNEAVHVLLLRIYVALGEDPRARRETQWLEKQNQARLRGRL